MTNIYGQQFVVQLLKAIVLCLMNARLAVRLSHGVIDVVTGWVDNSGKINWSFGIKLLAENEVSTSISHWCIQRKHEKHWQLPHLVHVSPFA